MSGLIEIFSLFMFFEKKISIFIGTSEKTTLFKGRDKYLKLLYELNNKNKKEINLKFNIIINCI